MTVNTGGKEQSEIERLQARVKELESPWISVEDRLPVFEGTVFYLHWF